jgi:hypothetical protein
LKSQRHFSSRYSATSVTIKCARHIYAQALNENVPYTFGTCSTSARQLMHAAYSPDIAFSNCHLFPKANEHLRGCRFWNDECENKSEMMVE